MRTLFWKIFVWFGAAQLLIAVALVLLASATQRGFDRGLARAVGSSLEARCLAAAVAFESGGLPALRAAWRIAPQRGRHGRRNDPENDPPPPLSGDSPFGEGPPPVQDAPELSPDGPEERRGASLFTLRSGAPKLLVGPDLPASVRSVVTGAFLGGSAVFDSGGQDGPSFIARRVQTPSGARYVGVEQMNFHGRGFGPLGQWLRPNARTFARFGVVALLMGAFCFGLARYLSAPARKLRAATLQFAGGDLSTRVAPQMGRRRDELADLGRDFDAMAERIEELVTAQSRLLSDISHELRSPLARLNVAVELAADTADGETSVYLERISEESAELDALIGQLLTLQRLESRETGVLKTDFDLAGLVSQVVADVDFEARSRGARVELKQLDACELQGNPELLKSAIQNVARNAVLHSGQSRVEVSLQKQPTEAVLSVRDFGVGVPLDSLDKLFDPFYRVATARDRQSGGTGLGLSITKRAVEAHGGTVQAFNAQGGGLRVEMRLPLTPN